MLEKCTNAENALALQMGISLMNTYLVIEDHAMGFPRQQKEGEHEATSQRAPRTQYKLDRPIHP